MIQAASNNQHTSQPQSTGSRAIADDFEVWSFDTCWRRTRSSSHPSTDLPAEDHLRLLQWLEEVSVDRTPAARTFNDDYAVLLVPVDNQLVPTVAVRWIDPRHENLLDLLAVISSGALNWKHRALTAESSLRAKTSQLQSVQTRITEGQDEIAWLKELARNAELSEAGDHTERVAENILPDLCDLLHARTVIFVRQVAMQSEDSHLPVIWQAGEESLERDVCLSLLSLFATDGDVQCVLKNFDTPQFGDEHFTGILSLILVPVASASMHVGWLIAVNKDLRHLVNGSFDPKHSRQLSRDACEFGEFDLSLMQAAGTVLASHAHNCRLFHQQEELLTGVVRSLVNTLDAKDSYTCGHSDRVADSARLIASQMNMDAEFCERIYMTGLLHDVGKIGVPDEVLNKPGQLSDEEFDLIRQHPVIGYEILSHLPNFSYVLPGVLHHHEAFNGRGYPHGLSGDRIPLEARILAVADAYDAMTSNRPYRRGMATDRAEAILRDGAGSQWDPDCIDAFFRCVDGVRLMVLDKSDSMNTRSSYSSSLFAKGKRRHLVAGTHADVHQQAGSQAGT